MDSILAQANKIVVGYLQAAPPASSGKWRCIFVFGLRTRFITERKEGDKSKIVLIRIFGDLLRPHCNTPQRVDEGKPASSRRKAT